MEILGDKSAMKRWALVVLYYCLIFFLSSLSRFDVRLETITLHDKVIHFFVFGIFGLLFAHAYLGAGKALTPFKWILAFIVLLTVGVSDEFHQRFVPGRHVDFFDWLADSAGALTFFFIYYYRKRHVPHRISKLSS